MFSRSFVVTLKLLGLMHLRSCCTNKARLRKLFTWMNFLWLAGVCAIVKLLGEYYGRNLNGVRSLEFFTLINCLYKLVFYAQIFVAQTFYICKQSAVIGVFHLSAAILPRREFQLWSRALLLAACTLSPLACAISVYSDTLMMWLMGDDFTSNAISSVFSGKQPLWLRVCLRAFVTMWTVLSSTVAQGISSMFCCVLGTQFGRLTKRVEDCDMDKLGDIAEQYRKLSNLMKQWNQVFAPLTAYYTITELVALVGVIGNGMEVISKFPDEDDLTFYSRTSNSQSFRAWFITCFVAVCINSVLRSSSSIRCQNLVSSDFDRATANYNLRSRS